ncbi:MAG: helix-turn-helix transcriptional regulator [Planctomycetaceae bacterium]|nr:helix-turn-helix transcriptional regulator [Planctomycetaceae bacterium]
MTETFRTELMRGSLDLMILSVLAEGEKYGYLIQQSLRDSSHGRADPKAGTLYPLLQRLENEKLIRSRWESETGRRRKWYSLTAKGKKKLQVQAEEWFELTACLEKLLKPVVQISPKPA